MPFFHDQDRSGLRRQYLEAWLRHRAGLPLEPLQHQLVSVIEHHPEYQILDRELSATWDTLVQPTGGSFPRRACTEPVISGS